MKNTGLSRLVIVDPPAYDPHRARWMAPGCDDVIASARIVATLDEALEGTHRAVATTARHRKRDQRVIEPRALAEEVLGDDRVTALLFGREDYGLSTDDVARCEAIVRIPTPEHASLNLAQAVLLVGHAIFDVGRPEHGAPGRVVGGRRLSDTASLERGEPRADLTAIQGAVDQLSDLLGGIGYPVPRAKLGVTATAALQRAGLSTREVGALRGLLRHVEWAVDRAREPKE